MTEPTADVPEVRLKLTPRVPVAAPPRLTLVVRLRQWLVANRGLVITVFLPSLLAAIYFSAVAADRYAVELRFIVRAPASVASAGLGGLLQGTGALRAVDETHAVHVFMLSRDAVKLLEANADLRARLTRPEADWYWRYPGWWSRSDTAEQFWRHMQRFVDLEYDEGTGISTLRVTAFRPDDARALALALLAESEKLINRLSERAQRDTLASAGGEVERARKQALVAQDALTAYRMRESIVDPTRATAAALEIIGRMAMESAQINAQLLEVQKISPQSPQIASFKHRLAALDEQMTKERRALAGDDRSMAVRIAEYERLVLGREFAERSFQSALTSQEAARMEAQRQRLYLETISSPGTPDYPSAPSRLLGTLLFAGLAYLLFRIARRLFADMLSHAEA